MAEQINLNSNLPADLELKKKQLFEDIEADVFEIEELAEIPPELHKDIALLLVEVGKGTLVVENLSHFSELDLTVAVALVKAGFGLEVMNNLDYFDGIDQDIIAEAMLLVGQGGFVRLNPEIFDDLSEEIHNKVNDLNYQPTSADRERVFLKETMDAQAKWVKNERSRMLREKYGEMAEYLMTVNELEKILNLIGHHTVDSNLFSVAISKKSKCINTHIYLGNLSTRHKLAKEYFSRFVKMDDRLYHAAGFNEGEEGVKSWNELKKLIGDRRFVNISDEGTGWYLVPEDTEPKFLAKVVKAIEIKKAAKTKAEKIKDYEGIFGHEVDTSPTACAPFGFQAGDRVETDRGPATVLGVDVNNYLVVEPDKLNVGKQFYKDTSELKLIKE